MSSSSPFASFRRSIVERAHYVRGRSHERERVDAVFEDEFGDLSRDPASGDA
jgi:hypothetical protein